MWTYFILVHIISVIIILFCSFVSSFSANTIYVWSTTSHAHLWIYSLSTQRLSFFPFPFYFFSFHFPTTFCRKFPSLITFSNVVIHMNWVYNTLLVGLWWFFHILLKLLFCVLLNFPYFRQWILYVKEITVVGKQKTIKKNNSNCHS